MFISMFLGVPTALFEIMYYAIIRTHRAAIAETGLYLFLTFTALIVIFSIRNQDHFWKAPKLSKTMKLAFGVISVVSLAIVYIPSTQRLLSFSYFPLGLLAITALMTVIYFLLLDAVKVWFYKTAIGKSI